MCLGTKEITPEILICDTQRNREHVCGNLDCYIDSIVRVDYDINYVATTLLTTLKDT